MLICIHLEVNWEKYKDTEDNKGKQNTQITFPEKPERKATQSRTKQNSKMGSQKTKSEKIDNCREKPQVYFAKLKEHKHLDQKSSKE